MFKSILVPLDGSYRAERAIPVAARIARTSSASIILSRIVETPTTMDYPVRFIQPDLLIGRLSEHDMLEATEYLERVAQSDDLKGLQVKTLAMLGSPALKVLETAKVFQTDLIVMCSHGYTGFKRWMLGSVADKIVRHTSLPVLILREQGSTLLPPITSIPVPLRTLVTLDGSKLAEETLEPTVQLLLSLAAVGPKELHLLSVIDMPTTIGVGKSMPFIGADRLAEAEQQALAYLTSITQRLQKELPENANIAINSTVVGDSDIATAIIKVAESEDQVAEAEYPSYDLIAMATHGRSLLPRWVVGSITARVLHSTTLPLFIVHPKKLAATEEADVDTDKQHAEAERTEVPAWSALF